MSTRSKHATTEATTTKKNTTKRSTKPRAVTDQADRDRAVYRFEAARHRAASKAADAILGRSLTFWEVLNADEYSAFVRRVQREEATLRDSKREILNDASAEEAAQKIESALSPELRDVFARYDDWRIFVAASEAEAAFLIGLALGRR
jgi:hypothetical protein